MSLLSSTQGTPERVWSLVKLLDAHDRTMPREAVLAWLSPSFIQGGQARVTTGEPDGQALGAASSLALVRREGAGYVLERPPAASFSAFADQVHEWLAGIDGGHPDEVLLEAFAFVVVEVERRQSTAWIAGSPSDVADAVEHAIGSVGDTPGERRFNSTKLAPWRRWIAFIGLAIEFPGMLGFHPQVTERLLRELGASDLPRGRELPVAEVLAVVAARMPYLDGGALLSNAARRIGVGMQPRRLSYMLSSALRDLHDEGAIELGIRGDASDVMDLAPDGQHPVKSVQTIILREGQR